MDKLLLVDGMAVMYRSFFAVKNLTRSDGVPVNALFGFIRLLDQALRHWTPTHCAVVWDGGIPERRLAVCPEYKAQRPPMPDELRSQFPAVNDYLARRQLAAIMMEGEEADDVMAALAHQGEGVFEHCLIASGDKDMLQIVDDYCRVVSVAGKAEEAGPEQVKARTGVLPHQITDWLALIGDSADNIKGVNGVGPKTATKLLNEYGNIEGIYAALDALPAKLREKLIRERDLLERNRAMVTLKKDLDLPSRWIDLQVSRPDPVRLVPFFREWEFKDMQRALEEPELF